MAEVLEVIGIVGGAETVGWVDEWFGADWSMADCLSGVGMDDGGFLVVVGCRFGGMARE